MIYVIIMHTYVANVEMCTHYKSQEINLTIFLIIRQYAEME